MALTLSQLVNDYGSYSGNTLIGDLGSRATVPGGGFGGVRGVPYDNITFIVKVNGTRYASSRWLSQQQNGNPYIHSTSVARVDARDIGSMSIDKTPFANREDEKYAEVEATSKLTSDDEILKFINYLLDGKDGTAEAIPTFGSFGVYDNGDPEGSLNQTIQNPGSGEEYEVSPIRVFSSKTISRSKKSWLGSYSSENDLAGVYPGLGFEPTNFDGTLFGPDAQSQSIPAIPSEEVKEVVDLGEDFEIDLSDFELQPIDINFDDFDFGFGFGDINTDFGFGLGGDVSVGGTGQFTQQNNNNAGIDSFAALSNEGGLEQVGLGSYNEDYSGQPLGAMFGSFG